MEGHHYALVRVEGLETGERYEYGVELDGERVWPPRATTSRQPQFRTYPKEHELQIAFGSCRVAAPSEPPYTLDKDEDDRGREHDALAHPRPADEGHGAAGVAGPAAHARRPGLRRRGARPRPRSSSARTATRASRPGEIALTFEEYTRLYRESWGEPVIRWLLSTVSSAMIFDDHDVHDDWNTSEAWLEEIRATDWWDEHIVAGLMSYWIYQHAGNLSPDEQDADGLLEKVSEQDDAGDAAARVRRAARTARRGGSRWSYHRDLGDTRLVMIDSRCGRGCSTRATARCSTTTSGTGSRSTAAAGSTTC